MEVESQTPSDVPEDVQVGRGRWGIQGIRPSERRTEKLLRTVELSRVATRSERQRGRWETDVLSALPESSSLSFYGRCMNKCGANRRNDSDFGGRWGGFPCLCPKRPVETLSLNK